ncbi:MAG: hypothetical protein IPG61_07785 [bacterium]|nr:hypothetical protein [bacterium]
MKRNILAVLAMLGLVVAGCGENASPPGELANFSEFDFVNASSRRLLVVVHPIGSSVVVEAGARANLLIVDGTSTTFPAPSDAITCISVYDNASRQLVYQQSPVVDDAWSEVRSAVKVAHYTLELSEDDLSSVELPNLCGR